VEHELRTLFLDLGREPALRDSLVASSTSSVTSELDGDRMFR
jgi:hypothetical protein